MNRRILLPVMIVAVLGILITASSAQAGLLFGHGCKTACAPACCEPACEQACAPACCEPTC